MSYFKPARLLAMALMLLAIGCGDRDNTTPPPPAPPKTPPPSPTAQVDQTVVVNFQTQALCERRSS